MADIIDTIKIVFKKALADDIMGTAARVAYYFFLAIFPGIIALFALAGIVGGDQAFEWIMSLVRQGLPQDAEVMIAEFVGEITGESRPGLLSLGILGVLWAASNSFNGLTIGLNKMYNIDEYRSWWKRRLGAVGLLIASGILLNLGATAILAGPELARLLGLDAAVVYVTWASAFLFITALFWLTYYLLPNTDQSSGKIQVLIGAAVGTVLWILASVLFRAYVANFGSFGATYGVLGGVIVLMLWLYITALAILFGGEVAATLQQRVRERTSPEP